MPNRRPDRYNQSIVPHIYVEGAAEGIAFYERAFGAVELFRVTGDDGRIVHAELAIEGQVFMMGDPTNRALYDEPRALGRTVVGLHIMVDDNATLVDRAVAAGAELIRPPTDQYGASSASVRDPYGHVWVVMTWPTAPASSQ